MKYGTPVEALSAAVQMVNGQSALAAKLSELGNEQVTPARIWNWINRDGGAPVEFCAHIEKIVEGKVSRWDLRPADWFSIWPELIDKKGAPEVPAQQGA